jgi:hypothetical protein
MTCRLSPHATIFPNPARFKIADSIMSAVRWSSAMSMGFLGLVISISFFSILALLNLNLNLALNLNPDPN